jgi:hypothetical protein
VPPPAKRQRLAGGGAAQVSGAEGALVAGAGAGLGFLGPGMVVADTDARAEV